MTDKMPYPEPPVNDLIECRKWVLILEGQSRRAATDWSCCPHTILNAAGHFAALIEEIASLRAQLAKPDDDARDAEPSVFAPHWPSSLEALKFYRVPCDDKGRCGGSWLQVVVANDGDVHVSMQDWERVPEGEPSPFPSIRIRTMAGGGHNLRTRQALIWLAEAIRIDTDTAMRGEVGS